MVTAPAAFTTDRRQNATRPSVQRKGIIRKLRNQGGATVLSIPSYFLAEMGVGAGTDLEMSLVDGKLVVEPKAQPSLRRKRYTIAELLEGSEHLPEIYAGTKDALDGAPFGKELG